MWHLDRTRLFLQLRRTRISVFYKFIMATCSYKKIRTKKHATSLYLVCPPVGVTFGKLFDDEEGQQFFEAIVGTLRAAKKRGVVDFKGQVRIFFGSCRAL